MLACRLISVVALGACGLPEGDYFGRVDPDPDPDHLRWCNAGEPEFIDPALVTSTVGNPIAYALFDGLTDYDEQGLPEPSLATHWDVSPDQRRFTFHLHDRGRWSNGRPITAHDFTYHLERVLHPLSFSRNAETLWKIKGGKLYTEGRIKLVLRDVAPFAAGDVVEIVADPDAAAGAAGADRPDSNVRTARVALRLRDRGAPESDAYAVVPPGSEVTLVALARAGAGHGGDAYEPGAWRATPAATWAYVHYADDDGVYGWVPGDQLTGQPHGDAVYRVRRISRPHRVGVDIPPGQLENELAAQHVTGELRGRELLTLPEVLGVRAPDPRTLVIETWGPVPYLIDLTAQRGFRATPREAVSRRPLRWTRPGHIVTSGPFHLVAWHQRDRLEMIASPTYWRRDGVGVERFTAYSMNDQAASTNYYMQGGCDALATNHIPTSYYQALRGKKRGGRPYRDLHSSPYLGIYYYLINTEKLTNVHLRRALSQSIDRRPIPRILHGNQIVTTQSVPGVPIAGLDDDELALCGVDRDTPGVAMIVRTGELCYVPPPGLSYDLDAARRELALAREQMGAAFPATISLKFNIGVEGHKLIAEYIQHEWREKLGVVAELGAQEWKTYLKATIDGDFEVGRLGNIGNFPDPESEFLSQFKCGAPNNRPRFCNDEFERLFAQAESTSDRKARLALIRRAEAVLISEAPVIPLFVYMQSQLQKPYVRNLPLNFPNRQPMYRAWIDPDWERRDSPAPGDAPR